MSTKQSTTHPSDDATRERQEQPNPAADESGTNAVEHEPDPNAKPIPDGEHKYMRRSPYTAGND